MRQCNQCGKCCFNYSRTFFCGSGTATANDVEMWETFAPHVLNYLGSVELPDMWFSPITGKELHRCPWLRKLPKREKYRCRIHDVRPETCVRYPATIEQMIEDGCEMLEDGDLDRPREDLMAELEELRNECELEPHLSVYL